MKKLVWCLALGVSVSLGLTGCAGKGSFSSRSLYHDPATLTTLVALPAKEVETEAEIGKSMVSISKRYKAISLEREQIHTGKYSDVYDYVLTVPAGLLVASGSDIEGMFFEATQPVLFQYLRKKDNYLYAHESLKGGLYVPYHSTKPTEVYWMWEGTRIPQNDAHPGITYTRAIANIESNVTFKRELVYSGISQNTVSILYREFLDDMARPAFYQELKYDLSHGNVIGYKGARFEVIKANNTTIRYRVLQELEATH